MWGRIGRSFAKSGRPTGYESVQTPLWAVVRWFLATDRLNLRTDFATLISPSLLVEIARMICRWKALSTLFDLICICFRKVSKIFLKSGDNLNKHGFTKEPKDLPWTMSIGENWSRWHKNLSCGVRRLIERTFCDRSSTNRSTIEPNFVDNP